MKQRNLSEDLQQLATRDFWRESRDEVILKFVEKGPIMDVGCGAGTFTNPLLKKGFNVYSIDIDKDLCEYTKKINEKTYCLDFSKIDTKKFPKVETIIMADVLEHCKDDTKMMFNAYNLLNKGGKFIITVPYHLFFWTKNDEARGHVRRYSKKELIRKLKENNFEIRRIRLRNLLAIGPLLLAKFFRFRIPHEGISKSKLNSLLLRYFTHIENKVSLPFGTELICVAYKE